MSLDAAKNSSFSMWALLFSFLILLFFFFDFFLIKLINAVLLLNLNEQILSFTENIFFLGLSFSVITRVKKLFDAKRTFSSDNSNYKKESKKNPEEIRNTPPEDSNSIFDIRHTAKNYLIIFVVMTVFNSLFIAAIYLNLIHRGFPTDHYFMQIV